MLSITFFIVMLSDIMLNVIMLNVVILGVMVPWHVLLSFAGGTLFRM